MSAPDYTIRVSDPGAQRFGTVGAGWLQEDGVIYIRLDPGCLLTYDPELTVRLIPTKAKS